MLRLNLGSGPTAAEGWENLDRSPNIPLDRLPALKSFLIGVGVLSSGHAAHWSRQIRRVDVVKGLPYPESSVDAVYSSHALEHLYFDDANRVLAHSHRVLRPGGIIRLALPDVHEFARRLVAGETDGLTFTRDLNSYPLARPKGLQRLISQAGASHHRWQPTTDLVSLMLQDAGFVAITECGFRAGSLPDLHRIENREESFFVEAIKP